MASPRSLLVTLTALAGLAFAGCTIGDDGPRTTETRDVPAFTRVDNRSSVDVRLHVGDRRHVVVRAGEQGIDAVRTEGRDGTLKLAFVHDGFGGGSVVVEATVPALRAIDHAGAGDIVAEGMVLRYHWGKLEVFYPDGATETVAVEEEPTITIGREFLRALETGDRSRLRQDYADAARSLAVCLAANESAETGQVVRLG